MSDEGVMSDESDESDFNPYDEPVAEEPPAPKKQKKVRSKAPRAKEKKVAKREGVKRAPKKSKVVATDLVYLTSGDVAELLGVSGATVQHYISAGKLQPVARTKEGKRGGIMLFTQESVESFQEAREKFLAAKAEFQGA